MPKYVMLSTLGPDGAATLVSSPERLRQVNDEVEAMGVKVLEQFALLGGYDFLNIIEAPDEKSIARVAMTLAARGTNRPRRAKIQTSRVPGPAAAAVATQRTLRMVTT